MGHESPLAEMLRDTILGMVRQDRPDLTARQLAVLLICSMDSEPPTVRGLAVSLGVAKPAISRVLDRLKELALAERAPDPRDRRSVLIVPTASGRAFVKELGAMMQQASA